PGGAQPREVGDGGGAGGQDDEIRGGDVGGGGGEADLHSRFDGERFEVGDGGDPGPADRHDPQPLGAVRRRGPPEQLPVRQRVFGVGPQVAPPRQDAVGGAP